MSIILKGIDKSKYARTFRIYPSGKVLELNDEGLLDNENPYQAIQIPTPHGRLIDADALELEKEVELADDWKTAHEIANCVKYAPTILKAEEER